MKKILIAFIILLASTKCFAVCETGYFPGSEANTTHKYIHCSTAAELPSAGMTSGDILAADDTGKVYVATSTTTYGATSAIPTADDQVRISDSATNTTWRAINDCQGAGKALIYTASNNTIGCNAGFLTTVDISSNTNLSVSGTLATLTGDTISFKAGTLTDEKICTYEVSGTMLDCNETETGSGNIVRATTPTLITPIIGAAMGTSLATSGLITSSSATAGIGYATGAGGTVTQATNKTTGVTINKTSGQITMNGAALAAAAEAKFTVTNSSMGTTDVPVVAIDSVGTSGSYLISVTAVGAGTFDITISNVSAGSLSEAVVINFVIIKGVSS